ncbi:hypothetical protein HF086_011504 [Spodoptera exigua]|uniref:Uncharacterized protein n=1 Tax=Spodoptera exigua TaxID=7107 RepID=A0A922SA76_SPOEX|nr:hypothetical protein HF086_011504 [Spodoptera exigua]
MSSGRYCCVPGCKETGAPLTPPSTTSLQQLNLGHGPSPSSLTATMQEAALPSTSETNVHLNLGEKTTVKKAKSRVFLTNTEKYLQDKLVAASIKLSKMKKLSVNVKAAKQIASNPAVCDILENCTSTRKLLISMQCQEDHKKEKERRFTLQEKIASLSIFKQSPKGYRFLRFFLFCLLSKH